MERAVHGQVPISPPRRSIASIERVAWLRVARPIRARARNLSRRRCLREVALTNLPAPRARVIAALWRTENPHDGGRHAAAPRLRRIGGPADRTNAFAFTRAATDVRGTHGGRVIERGNRVGRRARAPPRREARQVGARTRLSPAFKRRAKHESAQRLRRHRRRDRLVEAAARVVAAEDQAAEVVPAACARAQESTSGGRPPNRGRRGTAATRRCLRPPGRRRGSRRWLPR